ncbi:MAG: T9SS type A sorting domain-containing protein [Ignavibacteria bacterium]
MKKIEITLFVLFFCFKVSHSQWVQVSNEIGNSIAVYGLTNSGNTIFAGTNGQGVYLSTNSGANWTQTPLNNRFVYSLAASGSNIFAGTQNDYGLYLSTNMGATWAQTSLNYRFVFALLIDGNNIYAGTEYNNVPMGVYKSTDNGTTWTQTSLNNKTVRSFGVSGSNIFAGTAYDGVYLSTNNGTTWTQTSLNNLAVYSFAIIGNNIFAGTLSNGLYLSTNNGASWSQAAFNNQTVYSLAVNGSNIVAGTFDYGVYLSTNSGTNWAARNEGLPNGLAVYSFTIFNNYVFAGTIGAGSLYRRPFSELNGIKQISGEVPVDFALKQNYPNPFNPVTNIQFNIPKAGNVKLIVFDALGREAMALVNGHYSAGTYNVDMDASNLPSGVYFYRLESGSYYEVKKMLLVK